VIRNDSTVAVAAREQFPFWCEAVCATFVALDCKRPNSSGAFSGEMLTSSFGVLQATVVASDPHDAERSRRHLSRLSEDDILLSYQVEGHSRLEQNGRTAELSPGSFALYDSTKPYLLTFPVPSRQLVLKMPRAALRMHCEGPLDSAVATTIPTDHGPGDLAGSVFRSLLRTQGTVRDEDRLRMASIILDVVGLAASAVCPLVQSVTTSKGASLQRIKMTIETLISRNDLTAEVVSARSGLGVRALSRLFALENTSMMRYIWLRRLELCQRDLRNPLFAGRTVAEIAFSWGFNDSAHFSRAYKARFSMPPRQARTAHCDGSARQGSERLLPPFSTCTPHVIPLAKAKPGFDQATAGLQRLRARNCP